jgi:broad specificity phosphatase PhoE
MTPAQVIQTTHSLQRLSDSQFDDGTLLRILAVIVDRLCLLPMNPSSTHIHFVRHGEVHNPRGVFYGRLPRFSLSSEGRRQAEAAGRFLAGRPIVAIYSGPVLRARQTAQAIAALHRGLPVRTSQLLNEVDVPIQGLPLSEGIARDWDLYTGNQPPYESVENILKRMVRFTSKVRERHAGREVVAVTHGDPIGFLMLWAWGKPVTAGNKAPLYREYLALASITTFHFQPAQELPTLEYAVPYGAPS